MLEREVPNYCTVQRVANNAQPASQLPEVPHMDFSRQTFLKFSQRHFYLAMPVTSRQTESKLRAKKHARVWS